MNLFSSLNIVGLVAISSILATTTAGASTYQLDASGITTVTENSSGGPDEFDNTVLNFSGILDFSSPAALELPGVRGFSPFRGNSTVLGSYEASGETGSVIYIDDGGLFDGSPVDTVSIILTNIIADPDAPFVTNDILTTSGDVNGLPLGQIALTFFIDPAAGTSASGFSLADLPSLQSISTFIALSVIFDADVDATGAEIAGGPRLVLTALNATVSLTRIDGAVPVPGAMILMVTGIAGLSFSKRCKKRV